MSDVSGGIYRTKKQDGKAQKGLTIKPLGSMSQDQWERFRNCIIDCAQGLPIEIQDYDPEAAHRADKSKK